MPIQNVEKQSDMLLKNGTNLQSPLYSESWDRWVLKGAEAKPLTEEELEKVIRELYFEKYHVSKNMPGKTVEVRVTLRGNSFTGSGEFV